MLIFMSVFSQCILQPEYCGILRKGDGMKFEIKKTEYVNKTFRITKDLAEKLSTVAQTQGISMNELVVQCCEFALSSMDDTADGNP